MTAYLAFLFFLRAMWFLLMAVFFYLADARKLGVILGLAAIVPGPFEVWFTYKTAKVVYGLFQLAYPGRDKRWPETKKNQDS